MPDERTKTIEVFYSYAHEDEALLNKLKSHLSILRREGLITEWYDRQIVPGTEWEHVIDDHINTASIILLLISPDFIASDYCYSVEMAQAMQRHKASDACVIPIILRPADWTRAPLAELQALPTNAKPVTTWSNRDEAFVDIVKGMRKAIENFHTSLLRQDPTRFPNKSIRYFMSLEECLHPLASRFPTERDFEQDLVYLSETYVTHIKKFLQEKKRALLVGPSAAGKTVLALALAKRLEEKENFQVAYKDVSQQVKVGDGRTWLELVHAHDRERVLYILDNCHLAPEEVHEFCFQWEGKPPEHAQCILISRPSVGEQDAFPGVINGYLEVCADEKIKIRPVDLYWGVIEKYATAYRRQNPNRYGALENDSAELLKTQHAHNLVVSKSRLEAWYTVGGRLSNVKQDVVYRALKGKYLATGGKALPALCVLRQFEIRAHNFFVETKLPRENVSQLERQKLLSRSTVQNYGVLYDLVFHPALAREIFETHIYRQEGSVTAKRITSGIIKELEAYLKAIPPNYMSVYDGLARQGQAPLLEQLLTNRDLQDCAASQFETGNIADAIRYVSNVAKYDASRAHELLGILVRDAEPQDISSQITGRSIQNIVSMLQNLQQIHAETARKVVTAIDMQQLAQSSEKRGLQPLVSLLRVLKRISPEQAKTLLDNIPMHALAMKVSMSNMSSIEQLIGCMQELGYSTTQMESLFQALDVAMLVQRVEKENLQRLYWLLRALQKISPSMAQTYLEALTPAGLASLCCLKEAEIADIGQFRKVSSKQFWRLFLQQFSAQEIAVMCNRSPLGEIGTFLQYEYFSLAQGYALFQEQFLTARLATEPLDEIGKFIHRIQQAPGRGNRYSEPGRVLAADVLDRLATVDLSERIASNDLQQLALLLQNGRSVDVSYATRLISPLAQPEIIQSAFRKSPIGSIQMLIYNLNTVTNKDPKYVQSIRQALQNINLNAQLEKATLREIGLFLWNVYAYIDQPLAQEYCKVVDGQLKSHQLEQASLGDFCFFLWNITSVSNVPGLQVLYDPVTEKRLATAWTQEIGLGGVLLGIISFARSAIVADISLPPISSQAQKEHLTSWFTTSTEGQDAYMLALALRGLRISNEEAAQVIVRASLPMTKALQLLKSASPSAIKPRSILLMEETIEWLGRLTSEGK
ncbi:MAG: TIR domain-containing protein [Ktedonobacteraceae bacterium]